MTKRELLKTRIKVYPKGRITGVYFLFRGKEIVYVGATINIIPRISEHCNGSRDKVKKEFDSFSYIECSGKNLVELEEYYIEKYSPIYNKKVCTCEYHRRLAKISKKM